MIVKFFPKNEINVNICNYKYNAVAAVTQNTDRIRDNKFQIPELMLFKHNIQGTSFLNRYGILNGDNAINYPETLIKIMTTGRISFGIYFRTDTWKNPTTGLFELIPDYYNIEWTSQGVAAFTNAVLGAVKPKYYPNHGQDMFNISNGDYGYNFLTEISGLSLLSEINEHIEDQIDYFYSFLNKKLTSFSYANGANDGARLLIPYFFGGRNSERSNSGDSLTAYGISRINGETLGLPITYDLSRENRINRNSSTRAFGSVLDGTFPDYTSSISYAKTQVQNAIDNKGWFTDFFHWDDAIDYNMKDFYDPFFGGINNQIGSNFVWRCGYAEANEYLFFRDTIKRVASFEKSGEINVIWELIDVFKNTDTNGINNKIDISKLNTSISFKINISETSLSGKDIEVLNAESIIKESVDNFIITYPCFPTDENFGFFVIKTTLNPAYSDFGKPSILSATVNGELLTVNTDKPCNIVVWSTSRGGDVLDSIEVVRSSNMSTQNILSLSTTEQNRDVYIGIITEEKQSILSSVYQFL